MQLDRNNNLNGKGKYAIINLRRVPNNPQTAEELAAAILANPECVEFGEPGDPNEFWVIKLKDINAGPALEAYAKHAASSDKEYASQVQALANRSGIHHPNCKSPD